jgi:hypothetical protein
MKPDPFHAKKQAHKKMIDAGWTDTTRPPSLSAEYRLGLVRLEYHGTCETWRAKVGGNDWGYDGATPEIALQRCQVPAPAADDVRFALASLTRVQTPVQGALL